MRALILLIFIFISLVGCEEVEDLVRQIEPQDVVETPDDDPMVDIIDGCISGDKDSWVVTGEESSEGRRCDEPAGNGTSIIAKVMKKSCKVISRCHPIDMVVCKDFALELDNIDKELGIEEGIFIDIAEAIDYEKAEGIRFYPKQVRKCLADLGDLSCDQRKVKRAFNPRKENPLGRLNKMIPTSCKYIFKDKDDEEPSEDEEDDSDDSEEDSGSDEEIDDSEDESGGDDSEIDEDPADSDDDQSDDESGDSDEDDDSDDADESDEDDDNDSSDNDEDSNEDEEDNQDDSDDNEEDGDEDDSDEMDEDDDNDDRRRRRKSRLRQLLRRLFRR